MTGNLTIPEGVIKIGNKAFHNCADLTGVIIPDTCTTFGTAVFKGCSNLETVIFGENSQFRDFSSEAFKDCTSLKEITLYNLVSMGPSCFMNCTSLTRVQINSDRLGRIYEFAFAGCTELKEINIPTKSLLYFNVFNDCSNLSKIYFDGGLPDIRGGQSFENRVAPNALAIVSYEDLPFFGGYGADWYSLTVTINNSSVGKVFEALDAVLAERDGKIETINQLEATVEAKNNQLADQEKAHAHDRFIVVELENAATQLQLDLINVTAQRDARPTQEAYDTVVGDRDSKIETINQLQATVEAKNSTIVELQKRPTVEQLSNARAGRDLAIAEREALSKQLATTYTDFISMREERDELNRVTDVLTNDITALTSERDVAIAEKDARPTQEAYDVVVAERDSKIETINQLQVTVEANNSKIAKLEKRPTAEQLSTAIAERDVRPTQEAYDVVVAERDSKIENINELQSIVTAKNAIIAELEKRPTAEQLSTAIAERDARPTQEAYDVVVGERDARPTADELQDARNGSVVINSSNGEVIISFNIEESEDLKTWQATGEKITKTVQLKDGKKFYRFALDK